MSSADAADVGLGSFIAGSGEKRMGKLVPPSPHRRTHLSAEFVLAFPYRPEQQEKCHTVPAMITGGTTFAGLV
jgi:hypothetical protein